MDFHSHVNALLCNLQLTFHFVKVDPPSFGGLRHRRGVEEKAAALGIAHAGVTAKILTNFNGYEDARGVASVAWASGVAFPYHDCLPSS